MHRYHMPDGYNAVYDPKAAAYNQHQAMYPSTDHQYAQGNTGGGVQPQLAGETSEDYYARNAAYYNAYYTQHQQAQHAQYANAQGYGVAQAGAQGSQGAQYSQSTTVRQGPGLSPQCCLCWLAGHS
jgi:hypothetical protein